jgi:uncharacterized membrane protein YdjX (TVP38/TMEM64 family)
MTTTPAPVAERKALPYLKIIIGILILAAIIVTFRVLPVADWLKAFQEYVRGAGPIGYVVYALVYAICCVLFIPATVLTIGAGAIFGVVAGSIVVVAGATLGATLSFLLARTVMRKKVESMTAGNAKFRSLDRAITREGAKIVLLIRLAPVFPFTYINYAFGLTGIKLVPYVLATLFGILPGTIAFVYLSDAAVTAATGSAGQAKTIINIVGAVIALIASIFVARVATKAIKQAGVDDQPTATA